MVGEKYFYLNHKKTERITGALHQAGGGKNLKRMEN
jgi:hypothetical protein